MTGAGGRLAALAVLPMACAHRPPPVEAHWPEGPRLLLGMAEAMFKVLPFEAASVLLLATAVGVMALAKRQRTKRALAPAPLESKEAAA